MTQAPLRGMISVGSPAPRFEIDGASGQKIAFDTLAGRYVVLGFLGRTDNPPALAALQALNDNPGLIDGKERTLFWVVSDPQDEAAKGVSNQRNRLGVLWDLDFSIAQAFGAAAPSPQGMAYAPGFVVIDPRFRVLWTAPLTALAETLSFVAALPPPARLDGDLPAPVLILPRIFEPDLCRDLIAAYDAGEPVEGGFMRQIDGKTVRVIDDQYKRRADILLPEGPLRDAARARISSRLVPEVERAFQFKATRIERYIVSCYNSASGGFFKPHRDNTTTGTAHRRFAVTINLNPQDYEGGDLRFPEFGDRLYRAPLGGAVVFSCSLMHEATPVTDGRRYAFLPFLYDEAGAAVREANLHTVGEGVTTASGG